jgi:glycosyltransferase involved in cell wall biosynthesis
MRVLLLTSVYPTPFAPTKGTFNAALVAGLHLAGDDVRVIAPVPWSERVRRRALGPVADGVAHPVWWYPPKFGRASHHRWMRWFVRPAARVVTEEWTPDVVLGYWTHPDGAVALDVARDLRVPGVLLVGGSDILVLTGDAARRRIILQTLTRAAQVLAVGQPLRERVVALGVPAERVGVFARGVDRQRFSPGDGHSARARLGLPADRPIALWVGRMVPVKGLDWLLAAWARVREAVPDALLLLAGDGELRPDLERAAAAFGDSIRLVGSVPNHGLTDWYRAADLVVLPSRSEGVPNVLLEGLACGTPFVASAVGAVPDLVEPHSRAVPTGDIPALAAAITAALGHPPFEVRASGNHIPDRQAAVEDLRGLLARVVATPSLGAPS